LFGVGAAQSLAAVQFVVIHFLSFFFSPLYYMPFFDLQLLITPLKSSNLA
jgi:hypothetical protein